MGKNVNGGNKCKKYARKNNAPSTSTGFVRVSEDAFEIYAVATCMLGNNMFHCEGIDGVKRLCHIRKNFSGRGRKDNTISAGTWVLIGVREWDQSREAERIRLGKIPQCDVLSVYTDAERRNLTENVRGMWSILQKHTDEMATGTSSNGANSSTNGTGANNNTINTYNTDDLLFSNTDYEAQRQLLNDVANEAIQKVAFIGEDQQYAQEDEDINIDDI
jgi:translation initiation factor IF-1